MKVGRGPLWDDDLQFHSNRKDSIAIQLKVMESLKKKGGGSSLG